MLGTSQGLLNAASHKGQGQIFHFHYLGQFYKQPEVEGSPWEVHHPHNITTHDRQVVVLALSH